MGIRDIPPTGVRILPEIKDWLKSNAKENHRSMGAEINFILERYKNEQEANHA